MRPSQKMIDEIAEDLKELIFSTEAPVTKFKSCSGAFQSEEIPFHFLNVLTEEVREYFPLYIQTYPFNLNEVKRARVQNRSLRDEDHSLEFFYAELMRLADFQNHSDLIKELLSIERCMRKVSRSAEVSMKDMIFELDTYQASLLDTNIYMGKTFAIIKTNTNIMDMITNGERNLSQVQYLLRARSYFVYFHKILKIPKVIDFKTVEEIKIRILFA
jgi:hypothetical protein